MAITDLGHIALGCHDIEASIAFYAKLGVREAFRLNKDDGSVWLVYLHVGGDRFIELFTGGPEPGSTAAGSFRHLCLLTDDLHGLIDDLTAKGVTIDRPIKEGLDANLQAWITDPDGNAIELMQISDQSPQRAAVDGQPIAETDILKTPRL